jgi:MtaA/CmuA family methyltransferase
MNTKERFMKALRQEPVDRPPVAAVVTGLTVWMMERAGIFWPEAHADPAKMAGLAASVWEHGRLECIKLPFGMTIEVEALGAPIDYGTRDTLPTEVEHIHNHPDELIIPLDFFDRGRVPTVLKAIGLLRQRYDTEVAIVSSIVGPFTLAAKLFGFDNFFVWLVTEPDFVHQIMDRLTVLAIKYANAQVEAGADAIVIGGASCSGDLISSETYRDFIVPYHTRLCQGVAAPTIMHICGKSTSHAPFMADTDATAYSFDEGADITVLRQYLAGKISLAGYVPTVEVLLNGTPELVYRAALECLQNKVDVLAPGCSLPPHVSFENVAAMVQAAEDWGRSNGVTEPVQGTIAGVKLRANGSKANKGARRSRKERQQSP